VRDKVPSSNVGVRAAQLNRYVTQVRVNASINVAIAAATLALVSCSRDGNSDANTKKLRATLAALTLSSPSTDLDLALRSGDKRFICTYGYSTAAPGLGEAEWATLESHGQKCLEGTSDAIENSEHDGLLHSAQDYARQYNLELLRRIRQDLVT
jgi:hypothetical protein